jgi:hypothetical protein
MYSMKRVLKDDSLTLRQWESAKSFHYRSITPRLVEKQE